MPVRVLVRDDRLLDFSMAVLFSVLRFDCFNLTRAYRRESLSVHPDKGGDPASFRRLSKAHDVLLDPVLREK